MNAQANNVSSGMAQENLRAAALKAQRQQLPEDPGQKDNPGKVVSEQMSGAKWQEVEGKDGKKNIDLKHPDVYVATVSPALSKKEVKSPTAPKPVNFWDKTIGALKEKLGKLYGDTFSHNFFVAELAKMAAGAVRYSLSKLGIDHKEIAEIMKAAKQEKRAAIDTGITQVASEKVLFGIVTGARIA